MKWYKDFLRFALAEKKYFLIPMAVVLLLLVFFICFFQSAAVAPFVYTLF